MNSLPTELLIEIIKFLPSLNDIVNCKRICLKWKSAIEQNLKLKELVISDRENVHCLSWFFTGERTNCFNLIKRSRNFNINQSIFKQVKSLLIYSKESLDFDKLLNSLKALKRLEIKRTKFTSVCVIADLPKLIYLDLDSVEYDFEPSQIRNANVNLNFICPNLTHLKFRSSEFNLESPSSVRHLFAFTSYDDRAFVFETIKKCSNLEYLYINRLKREDKLDLNDLTNLKEVQVRGDQLTVLALKKTIQNRRNLKFYCFGVDSTYLSNDHLKELSSDKGRIILSYYDALASKLPFVDCLNYENLEAKFNQLPVDFADKFFALKSLNIESSVKNTQLLVNILKSFPNLNSLSIDGSELDQAFFNWLPTILKSLTSITLRKSNLSLNFLLEFKYLQHLSTDAELKSDLLYKLFTETKITNVLFSKGLYEIYMGIDENGPTFCKSYLEPYDYYVGIDEMFEAYRDAESWFAYDNDSVAFDEEFGEENESMNEFVDVNE